MPLICVQVLVYYMLYVVVFKVIKCSEVWGSEHWKRSIILYKVSIIINVWLY